MPLDTSAVATVAETEPTAAAATAAAPLQTIPVATVAETKPSANAATILPPPHPPAAPHLEECQYLELVRNILANGEHRPDRTGTGTLSLFAPPQLRFSLRNSTFPLLTTKRVFTKAIIHELLWFISGSTSSLPLSALGVKIWDGNGSRSYLDSLGFTSRAVGDLGPVYGFQWRHFGAPYRGPDADYSGEGTDQLQGVIDTLRRNPYDRRIILSAWNPADLAQMALPPCHMFAQFYVSFPPGGSGAGELSCVLYQRSCDMGLGVPFNIASYALLTLMVAHVCGLEPGEFVHTMGDAHVYVDHVDALTVQLGRKPRPFPRMVIKREKGCGIDDFKYEDFHLEGYDPWPSIKMNMSV